MRKVSSFSSPADSFQPDTGRKIIELVVGILNFSPRSGTWKY